MQHPDGWESLTIHYDDLVEVVAATIEESVDISEGIEAVLPVLALGGRIVSALLEKMLASVSPENVVSILEHLQAEQDEARKALA